MITGEVGSRGSTLRPASPTSHVVVASALLVYLGLLIFAYESLPGAPSNDVAEEVLSGYLMIRDGDYTPIYGKLNPHGHELLYVLVEGALVHAWGPGLLPILVPAWTSVLAYLVLLYLFALRKPRLLDGGVAVFVSLSFLWLFHYARTGLRTVATPALFMLFLLLLQATVRRPQSRLYPFAAGCVLALGTYVYTSFRVAVAAVAVFAATEVWIRWKSSSAAPVQWLRQAALMACGFLLPFAWTVFHAMRDPRTYLARGTYAMQGGVREWAVNLLHGIALPVYSGDRYRELAGPGYWFDPVAVALSQVDLEPIPLLLGIAFFAGLLVTWRRRSDPVVRFLLVFYVFATLLLGLTGPSLTRMLILVPTYAIVAAAGLAALPAMLRGQRFVLLGALTLIAAIGIIGYYRADPPADASNPNGAEMAAAVAERIRELRGAGEQPLCVVSQDRNLVRFLTIGHWDSYSLHEFFRRSVDPDEVGEDLGRAAVVLVDQGPQIRPWVEGLSRSGEFSRSDRGLFFELRRQRPASAGNDQAVPERP